MPTYVPPTCSDILTRNSFLNAIAIVNVLGGSTNAVRTLSLSPSLLLHSCVLRLAGARYTKKKNNMLTRLAP